MIATDNKPRILSVRTAARSRLFEIESVRLQFQNGLETEYERISSTPIHGAVVVVPMLDSDTFLLVREYAVGLDRYELGLPKGLIRANEPVLEAARERGCFVQPGTVMTDHMIAAMAEFFGFPPGDWSAEAIARLS